ncbi:hypothetical protein [Lentzea sp.]|nr:hypothetical protein [Lentzea sp.]HUQ56369.1 hypothetical protein [Lentzea sp.]
MSSASEGWCRYPESCRGAVDGDGIAVRGEEVRDAVSSRLRQAGLVT